jgi:hypothetical protein
VLPAPETAKEAEKKGTSSPVIVPIPGNITTPSPIKSLKTPPSNTNVKRPPAVTKTFVQNQFNDEEYLKGGLKKTAAADDVKSSDTKPIACPKTTTKDGDIDTTKQQKPPAKVVFQKPKRAIDRMIKEGRTHPDPGDLEFNK